MDFKFWCAFSAGLSGIQAVYGMLLGRPVMAWLLVGLAIINIFLYNVVKAEEDDVLGN